MRCPPLDTHANDLLHLLILTLEGHRSHIGHLIAAVLHSSVNMQVRRSIASALLLEWFDLPIPAGLLASLKRLVRNHHMTAVSTLASLERHKKRLATGNGVRAYVGSAVRVLRYVGTMSPKEIARMTAQDLTILHTINTHMKMWVSSVLRDSTTYGPLRLLCLSTDISLCTHPSCADLTRVDAQRTLWSVLDGGAIPPRVRDVFMGRWEAACSHTEDATIQCEWTALSILCEIMRNLAKPRITMDDCTRLIIHIIAFRARFVERSVKGAKKRYMDVLVAYKNMVGDVAWTDPCMALTLCMDTRERNTFMDLTLARRIFGTIGRAHRDAGVDGSSFLWERLRTYYMRSLQYEPHLYTTHDDLCEVAGCMVAGVPEWNLPMVCANAVDDFQTIVHMVAQRSLVIGGTPPMEFDAFMINCIRCIPIETASPIIQRCLGEHQLYRNAPVMPHERDGSFEMLAESLVDADGVLDAVKCAELLHHSSGPGALLWASTISELDVAGFVSYVRSKIEDGLNEMAVLTGRCILRADTGLTKRAVEKIMATEMFPTFCAWALVFLHLSGMTTLTPGDHAFVESELKGSSHHYSTALWKFFRGEVNTVSHPLMKHPGPLIAHLMRTMDQMAQASTSDIPTAIISQRMREVRQMVAIGFADLAFLWWVMHSCDAAHSTRLMTVFERAALHKASWSNLTYKGTEMC